MVELKPRYRSQEAITIQADVLQRASPMSTCDRGLCALSVEAIAPNAP